MELSLHGDQFGHLYEVVIFLLFAVPSSVEHLGQFGTLFVELLLRLDALLALGVGASLRLVHLVDILAVDAVQVLEQLVCDKLVHFFVVIAGLSLELAQFVEAVLELLTDVEVLVHLIHLLLLSNFVALLVEILAELAILGEVLLQREVPCVVLDFLLLDLVVGVDQSRLVILRINLMGLHELQERPILLQDSLLLGRVYDLFGFVDVGHAHLHLHLLRVVILGAARHLTPLGGLGQKLGPIGVRFVGLEGLGHQGLLVVLDHFGLGVVASLNASFLSSHWFLLFVC